MTSYMFDGAFGEAEIDLVANTPGAVAVNHYLTGPYATSSFLPDAAHARGLACVLNYERAPGALVGATRADGQAIGQQALAAIEAGCPRNKSVAIYFSVDVDTGATTCDSGFQGVRDVVSGQFQVRCYAPQNVLEHLANSGLVDGRQWLAASTYGRAYNPGSSNVGMVQSHDINGNWINTPVPNTDINTLTTSLAGIAAWGTGVNVPILDATDLANIFAQDLAAIRQALTLSGDNMTIVQNGQADNDNAFSIMNGRLVAIAAAVGAVQSSINSVSTAVAAVNAVVQNTSTTVGKLGADHATEMSNQAQMLANQATILAIVSALPTSGWQPSDAEIAELGQALAANTHVEIDNAALAAAVRHDFADSLAVDQPAPTPPAGP